MASSPQDTAFDGATALGIVAPGRFSAECDAGWFAPIGPNGGYLAALVVRAMEAEVSEPGRHARSVTLHYLRAPVAGPVQISVTTERRGRRASYLSARLAQDGQDMLLALGAFAADFPAAAEYDTPAPELPDHGSLEPVPFIDGTTPAIVGHMDMRVAVGPWPFTSGDEALTGGWLRLAEPRAPDAALLACYADAWWPAPFSRLDRPVGAPTIDLTIHFRAPDVTARIGGDEPLRALFRSGTAHGGFFEEDGALWSADGTLLAQSRQHALLRA